MKLLTDEEMKSIGKSGRQSLLYMHEIAEAQAKLTAKEIFEMVDKLIHEPLPSTRLSNNFGVIIRESYQEFKKQFGVD